MSDETIAPNAEPAVAPVQEAPAPAAPAGPPPEVAAAAAAAAQAAQQPAVEPETTAPAEGGLLALIGEDVAKDPAAAASIDLVNLILEGKDVDLERAFGRALEEDDPRFIDERYLIDGRTTAHVNQIAFGAQRLHHLPRDEISGFATARKRH